jgi:hypothetical protein
MISQLKRSAHSIVRRSIRMSSSSLHLFDLTPGLVIEAAHNHRTSLKNPPKTVEEYLDSLESQGLTQTASALREYMF